LMGIGFALMFLMHKIHYRYYARIAQILLVISVPLLIYTLFFGTSKNEAARWITLPVVGLTFQASDLAKLALMMYLARELAVRQTKNTTWKESMFSIMLPVMGICALILPANLSTAVMLFATSMLVMFIGRMKMLHLLSAMGVIAGAVAITILIVMTIPGQGRFETWKKRIETFGDSREVPYQVQQAK